MTATYTIELVLRQNGHKMGVRVPVEWVASSSTAARQAAYDVLLEAQKAVTQAVMGTVADDV